MKFSDLTSFVKTYQSKSQSTLLIIPLFKEYDFFFRHFNLLSKQSSQQFDVIVILDPVSDEKTVFNFLEKNHFDFGIIITKMRQPIGPAGAFFIGQKFALESGYSNIIHADIDCFPIDSNLIEQLHRFHDYEVVTPKVRLLDENGQVITEKFGLNYYTMLSTALVRKAGLVFYPIFMGGDDTEYLRRVNSKAKHRILIDSYVQHKHPSVEEFPSLFTRSHYIVHGNLFSKPYPKQLLLFTSLFAGAIFYEKILSQNSIKTLLYLVTFSYGKKIIDVFRENTQHLHIQPEMKEDAILLDFSDGKSLSELMQDHGIFPTLLIVASLLRVFRKKVILRKMTSINLTALVSLLSSGCYYQGNNKSFLKISDNPNPVSHMLKILLFLVFAPFFLLVYYPSFLLVQRVNHPRTIGFGLI